MKRVRRKGRCATKGASKRRGLRIVSTPYPLAPARKFSRVFFQYGF